MLPFLIDIRIETRTVLHWRKDKNTLCRPIISAYTFQSKPLTNNVFDFYSIKGWIRSEFGMEKNLPGIMFFCCNVQRKTIFHLIRRMVISCGEIISKSKVTCLHIALFISACCKTEASSKPPGSSCECAEMRQINEDWQQDQAQEKVWASACVECKCLQNEWTQSCQSGEPENTVRKLY